MATDIDVSGIVRGWLEQHGFDGLFHAETECGCHLADFLICQDSGSFHECRPAYKFETKDGGWWMSPDKNWKEKNDRCHRKNPRRV